MTRGAAPWERAGRFVGGSRAVAAALLFSLLASCADDPDVNGSDGGEPDETATDARVADGGPASWIGDGSTAAAARDGATARDAEVDAAADGGDPRDAGDPWTAPQEPPDASCGTDGALVRVLHPRQLAHCTTVYGNLDLGDGTFENVDDLVNLREVTGYLLFFRNPNLTQIRGLRNLESVGGNLAFRLEPLLTTLDGLESLRSVGGSLSIDSNDVLRDIGGLAGLQRVAEDLNVTWNEQLTTAAAQGLATRVEVGGNVKIEENAD